MDILSFATNRRWYSHIRVLGFFVVTPIILLNYILLSLYFNYLGSNKIYWSQIIEIQLQQKIILNVLWEWPLVVLSYSPIGFWVTLVTDQSHPEPYWWITQNNHNFGQKRKTIINPTNTKIISTQFQVCDTTGLGWTNFPEVRPEMTPGHRFWAIGLCLQ